MRAQAGSRRLGLASRLFCTRRRSVSQRFDDLTISAQCDPRPHRIVNIKNAKAGIFALSLVQSLNGTLKVICKVFFAYANRDICIFARQLQANVRHIGKIKLADAAGESVRTEISKYFLEPLHTPAVLCTCVRSLTFIPSTNKEVRQLLGRLNLTKHRGFIIDPKETAGRKPGYRYRLSFGDPNAHTVRKYTRHNRRTNPGHPTNLGTHCSEIRSPNTCRAAKMSDYSFDLFRRSLRHKIG